MTPARDPRISRYYRERLMSGNITPEEREYIKRKITAAQCSSSRSSSAAIRSPRLAAIVDHQTQFLDEGPETLCRSRCSRSRRKSASTSHCQPGGGRQIHADPAASSRSAVFVGGTRTEEGEDVAWDIIRIRLQEVVR